jgi:hypothetical protein
VCRYDGVVCLAAVSACIVPMVGFLEMRAMRCDVGCWVMCAFRDACECSCLCVHALLVRCDGKMILHPRALLEVMSTKSGWRFVIVLRLIRQSSLMSLLLCFLEVPSEAIEWACSTRTLPS